MSHASLVNVDTGDTEAWKRESRLSLSGMPNTALNFLNNQPANKCLVFCLDKDRAERETIVMMARKYAMADYKVFNNADG